MVVKEREIAERRGQGNTARGGQIGWKVPQGGTIREVTRDATGQVIERYSEALKKLKKH